MKKILVLIIVLFSFCFIEKADAQTCPKCEADGYDYNPMYSTDISFCTNETSKTLQATYEVMVDYTGSIPECSDDCCYGDYFYACTDGKLYHNAGMPAGQWDITCYDADLDGIIDDGDNSTIVGDNTCAGGSILNCDDNCRTIPNPGQEDSDEDGVGDICDNCPMNWNPRQWDCNADGTGDVCDSEPDLDNDGVPDDCDNCLNVSNNAQHDFDADGSGNACDPVLNGDYILHSDEDVSAMAGIIEVTGNLGIAGNDALTSLTGLESLTNVGGYLLISSDVLTNLSGLDNITSVGDYLWIGGNDALTSLNGLDKITSIASLRISGNGALTSLNGLNNISRLPYRLWIAGNDALTSLNGLDNIISVGGTLEIENNDALTCLRGLNNITRVGGSLEIENNDALTSLSGLYGVQLVNGLLYINNNTNLCMKTAQALEDRLRLNGYTGTSNYIYDNFGTICPPEISTITTNQGPDNSQIQLNGIPVFSLPSEKLQWIPSDPDADPEPGEMWEKTLGIAHSYISYWKFEMSEYSPETELILNDNIIGYYARWKWFSPAAYLPNDGLFWIKLIAEDADGNRSEVIQQVRVDTTDTDEDSIPDVLDNCPETCNMQQLDADEDSIGDVCDPDPGCTSCGQFSCEQECSACDFVDRFLDNGDGTVTDCRTSLLWLQNVNCYGIQNWYEAMVSSAELNSGECGLTDGSVAGDWRLPTKEDFENLFIDYDGAVPFEWPSVFTDFIGISWYFWSSTDFGPSGDIAYFADTSVTSVYGADTLEFVGWKDGSDGHGLVWPVRSAN